MPARRGEHRTQLNAWVLPETADYVRQVGAVTGENLGKVLDALVATHKEHVYGQTYDET